MINKKSLKLRRKGLDSHFEQSLDPEKKAKNINMKFKVLDLIIVYQQVAYYVRLATVVIGFELRKILKVEMFATTLGRPFL